MSSSFFYFSKYCRFEADIFIIFLAFRVDLPYTVFSDHQSFRLLFKPSMRYLTLAFSAFLVALGQTLLSKLPTPQSPFSVASFFSYSLQLLLPLSVYALALCLWIYTLSNESLVYAYPVLVSLSLVFVALFSVFTSSYSLNLTDFTGLILVIAGSFLLTSGKQL